MYSFSYEKKPNGALPKTFQVKKHVAHDENRGFERDCLWGTAKPPVLRTAPQKLTKANF